MLLSVLLFLQTMPGEGVETGGVAAMPALGSPEGRFEDAQVSERFSLEWDILVLRYILMKVAPSCS